MLGHFVKWQASSKNLNKAEESLFPEGSGEFLELSLKEEFWLFWSDILCKSYEQILVVAQ